MMNKLIEKLKQNKTPFGLLEENKRKLLKYVGEKNCDIFSAFGWLSFKSKFSWTETYRIKSNYPRTKEPEEEDEYVFICVNGKRDRFTIMINMLGGPGGKNR